MNLTPLHNCHLAAGARMVDFAGWNMPVQYEGILAEHRAVRSACGIFDISHMGEFFIRGPQSAEALDYLLTNSASKLEPGSAHYTLLLNESGGIEDDLYLYRLESDAFLAIVNASCRGKDAEAFRRVLPDTVEFEDASGRMAAVAVQGPESAGVITSALRVNPPKERNRVVGIEVDGERALLASTGYTGEAGYEIVLSNALAPALWERLIQSGAQPCGLGARDVLRLEMGYPLNGNDLNPSITPLMAGLKFFVDFTKTDFVGKSALVAQQAGGIPHRLVALRILGKSPPLRPHYPVWDGATLLGETTSGALSPVLHTAIAMALLPADSAHIGNKVEIEIRSKRYPAGIVKKPFIPTPK